jgi:hypothetical protein
MTNALPNSDALTVSINGELYRFPGNEARAIRHLVECRGKNQCATMGSLETAVWGGPPPSVDKRRWNSRTSAAYVLVHSLKQRCPGLVISGPDRRGWMIAPGIRLSFPRKQLPDPKKGHKTKATLILRIDGVRHDFHGREAKMLRLLLADRSKFRTVRDIMVTALGLDPRVKKDSVVYKPIGELRRRIGDVLFQSGGPRAGWRLNPCLDIHVSWDAERVAPRLVTNPLASRPAPG